MARIQQIQRKSSRKVIGVAGLTHGSKKRLGGLVPCSMKFWQVFLFADFAD